MEEERLPRIHQTADWAAPEVSGATPAGRPRPPRRSGRRRLWAAVAALLFLAAGGAWFFLDPWGQRGSGVQVPGLTLSSSETAVLYFADPRWTKLVTEERKLSPRLDAVARMRALFEALAQGPRGEGGAPVLPKGSGLRAAYVGKDGLAILDLEPWPEGTDLGGVSGELLTVFSLVHTMTRNVPNVLQVQLLVGGEERETLSGHVKISEPLRPEAEAGTAR